MKIDATEDRNATPSNFVRHYFQRFSGCFPVILLLNANRSTQHVLRWGAIKAQIMRIKAQLGAFLKKTYTDSSKGTK